MRETIYLREHHPTMFFTTVTQTPGCYIKNTNNTLPDRKVEPDTSCSAVTLAIARPTSHKKAKVGRLKGNSKEITVTSNIEHLRENAKVSRYR